MYIYLLKDNISTIETSKNKMVYAIHVVNVFFIFCLGIQRIRDGDNLFENVVVGVTVGAKGLFMVVGCS